MDLIFLIPFCTLFYLVGSFNFAKMFAKLKKQDLSKIGSGSAGATNTLRVLGPKIAITVLLLDIIKGIIPTLIGMFAFNDYRVAMLALGLATAVGHCFPMFSKFKGGKGAATIVGVFLVVSPIVTAVAFGIGFIVHCTLKQQSIASIGFVAVVVFYEILTVESGIIAGLFIIFLILVLFTHRNNILSLLAGTEKRVSLIDKIIQKVKSKKTKKQS